MNKEMKISLAVVSGLLVTFGALVARKMLSHDGPLPDDSAVAQDSISPFSSRDREDRPVELVRNDRGDAADALSGARWRDQSRADYDVPRSTYLPSDVSVSDRYSIDREAVDAVAETGDRRSLDPFSRRSAPAVDPGYERRDLDDHSQQPSRLEATRLDIVGSVERPDRAARNPVRQVQGVIARDESDRWAGADVFAKPGNLDADEASRLPVHDDFSSSRFDPPATPDAGAYLAPPTTESDAPVAASEPLAEPRYLGPTPTERTIDYQSQASPPANGKYTIQPNDSLWIISEKVYGTGRYFKAIAEHNRANLPHPDRLKVGTEISVPAISVLEQRYPTLVPSKQHKSVLVQPRTVPASTRQRMGRGENVYIVEQGDTLFDIARYELGKASRWAEIYDLNRTALGEEFDYLQPGTQLTMPPRSTEDAVTRQRDRGYQR